MSEIKLYNDDCFDVLKTLEDNSVDCVIIDPPYGTTPLSWDKQVNFKKLWEELNRVTKDNAAILVFAQEPFASELRLSNIINYRYDWYWEKERLTNVFQVKRRPGKTVENICVFYKNQPTYNPQKSEYTGKPVSNKIGDGAKFSATQVTGNQAIKPLEYVDDGTRYPTQVLRFTRDNPRERLHPTQKPVELISYLINTYTNEGDTVLDCFMGSGTTGVSAVKNGRNFIGVELDNNYFDIAEERIYECQK